MAIKIAQALILFLMLLIPLTPGRDARPYVPKARRPWLRKTAELAWETTTAKLNSCLQRIEEMTAAWGTVQQRTVYRVHQRRTTKASTRVMAMSVLALSATNAYGELIHQNTVKFDTDSGRIRIDNRCSVCILHCIDDFEGPLHNVSRAIKGFDGKHTHNIKPHILCRLWSARSEMPTRATAPNNSETTSEPTLTTVAFNLNGPSNTSPVIIEEEEERQPTTEAAELL